ncbi:MAG: ABC transporter ATP-binding protein [Mariprofundaceae bacterium]|nr:ABC transporter ATP-binding protein [Mariprofundaceae bacterium]
MQATSKEVLLRVSGLNKSYQSASGSLNILKDVDFVLYRGEFLAVVGESGAGKSTLLQVLGTLDDPDSGEAYLAEQGLFTLNQRERARLRNHSIGFVYQAHHLIPELNALENVMLPLLVRGKARKDAEQDAIDLLEKLGLKSRLSHVPAKLSGGEAQRVAVARALVGKPSLLLVDEPTGNLDEVTAQGVFQAMQLLCQQVGTAVIMVTHNMELARRVDRVLRLKKGKLIAADV